MARKQQDSVCKADLILEWWVCVSVAISVISSISEESPSNNDDHNYVPLGYHRYHMYTTVPHVHYCTIGTTCTPLYHRYHMYTTVLTCVMFIVSSLTVPHVHHWGTVLTCLMFIVSLLIVQHVHHWGTVLTCLMFIVSLLIVQHVHHWGTVLTCLMFIVSLLTILSTNTSEGIQQLTVHLLQWNLNFCLTSSFIFSQCSANIRLCAS